VKRIAALLGKEFLDLRLNPWIILPAAIAGLAVTLVPLIIAVIIPAVTGEALIDSGDLEMAVAMIHAQPGLQSLDPESAMQAFVFQQFLFFLILIPVIGSTSAAAHSIVSEKEARTLEPILATPITTFELLTAKVLGALLPALALVAIYFVLNVLLIALLARPGVYLTLLTARALSIVFVLAPLAVFAALQAAVCVSSRVNDERTAQAVGSLAAMPLVALLVAPIMGVDVLSLPVIFGSAVVLVLVNAGLMRLSIAVFDRESILTRWK
jgi:ABC-2 type transport system permease protein